ncbi:hypothetical protein K501DRAFT_269774 [Backusella circina FSU 941]|nr:hypothetical protein K501DRAFT_269774 [Backusella circina FSU 941]
MSDTDISKDKATHSSTTNYLPSDLYTSHPFSLSTLVFIRFYSADGQRKSDCLLINYGVSAPRLNILAAANFGCQKSTLNLDLIQFTNYLSEISDTNQNLSKFQREFLKYFSCCQRCVVDKLDIKDHKFIKQTNAFFCILYSPKSFNTHDYEAPGRRARRPVLVFVTSFTTVNAHLSFYIYIVLNRS